MAKRAKLYLEKHVKTAEAFLDQLSSNHVGPLWDRPDVEGWIFRGIRDASWPLQPSAFRIDTSTGNPAFTRFKPGQIHENPYATLKEQIDQRLEDHEHHEHGHGHGHGGEHGHGGGHAKAAQPGWLRYLSLSTAMIAGLGAGTWSG